MPIYRWTSSYKSYFGGADIIVSATSVKRARALAVAKWDADYGINYICDADWYAKKKGAFLNVIATPPKENIDNVVIVMDRN